MLYSPESRYYYMFLSFGGLAANGGYNIRLGRSRRPDGPFLDAAGNDLTNVAGAPGTLFDDVSIAPYGVKVMGNWQFLPVAGEPAAATTGYLSPGHNSAYYDRITRRHFLVFHTRFAGRGEAHQVRVHQLFMNAEGWLVEQSQDHRGRCALAGRGHVGAGAHGPQLQSSQMATDASEVPGQYSPPNCPWCGEPLRFDCTAEDAVAQSWSVPVFECRTHGSLYLTPEGLQREPPATGG